MNTEVLDSEFSDKASKATYHVVIQLNTGITREFEECLTGIEIQDGRDGGFLVVREKHGSSHFFNPDYVVSCTMLRHE